MKHKYQYKINLSSDSSGSAVISMVGNNKNVLEIGCGPGSITKHLFEKNNCRVTGLDNDFSALSKVKPYCEKIIKVDLNSDNWLNNFYSMKSFDVIVAADVLEHLNNPWLKLKNLSQLLSKDGFIVISLPHIGHISVIAMLINGGFNYREWGLLDKTHMRFFGFNNIEHLCDEAGYQIIDYHYVIKHPIETEFYDDWIKISRKLKNELNLINHGKIYQIVLKVIPKTKRHKGVKLKPPPNLKLKSYLHSFLKKILISLHKKFYES